MSVSIRQSVHSGCHSNVFYTFVLSGGSGLEVLCLIENQICEQIFFTELAHIRGVRLHAALLLDKFFSDERHRPDDSRSPARKTIYETVPFQFSPSGEG